VIALKFLFKATSKPIRIIQDDRVAQNSELQKVLIKDFGLTLRQAQKTIKTYPIPYIKESLAIIKIKI